MEIKTEKCNDCIYNDPAFLGDCEKCENGSNQLTYAEFEEDMEIYHEDADDESWEKAKELELKYFPIRWLIRLMLKYLTSDCIPTWFCGITKRPSGKKQENDFFPNWLRMFFPNIYIYQWRDGGYSGDDYAGNLYIRLFPFVWLEFGYEC